MKNVRLLFVALAALVSTSSMALVQPAVPMSEDLPMRVSAGLRGGFHKVSDKFGMRNLGFGVGFAHNVGYDFEYGISVGGDYAAAVRGDKGGNIFVEEYKDNSAMHMDVELMARFMPELAERFNLGGQLVVGYGTFLSGKDDFKKAREAVAFGDMEVKVGPAMSFGFSDMVSMYFTPAYKLSDIRFGIKEEAKKPMENVTNLSGVELPLGFWFAIADNMGIFLEANTNFKFIKDVEFAKRWREDVTLGMSFAI